MYHLPNGRTVDLDGAIDGVLDLDPTHVYFLDIQTGEVGCEEGEVRALDPKRYFRLPKIPHATQKQWLLEFISEIVSREDAHAGLYMSRLLKKGGIESVYKWLDETADDTGWVYGWSAWGGDAAFEELDAWIETLPVRVEYAWEGCGDCAVCRAMEEGGSAEELLHAFRNQSGGGEDARVSVQRADGDMVSSVETSLAQLIATLKLEKKLSVRAVKEYVWNESGSAFASHNAYMRWWMSFFKKQFDTDAPECGEILQICNDAWNYFPHKSLDGKSPSEMITAQGKNVSSSQAEMPRVRVGETEMSWNEYSAMLEEMERQQVPFRLWIEDAEEEYRAYLAQELALGSATVKKHDDVVHIFFAHALHVGFLHFDQIRPNFVTIEFPEWWQTHVMFRSLTEREIVASLKKFFTFLAAKRNITHPAFGSIKHASQ